jgi:hypothetical protein
MRIGSKWDIGPAFDWNRLADIAVYPVDLGCGIDVTESNIEEYYLHTERKHKGGYFPLGTNTVWHGGLHIHATRGRDVVHACAAGEIVAARLFETEEQGHGHDGSVNFVLCKHEVDGATLNRANRGRLTSYEVLIDDLDLRPEPASKKSHGKLMTGDCLDARDAKSETKDGSTWVPVEAYETKDATLKGKSGYVVFESTGLKPVYEYDDSTFQNTDRRTWYSLYMHLNPETINDANDALKDIAWIRRARNTGLKVTTVGLRLRDAPDGASKQPSTLANGAELRIIDPAPEAVKVGDYNWQYVEVVGGDTALAGQSGWVAAESKWTAPVATLVLDDDLACRLQEGGVVRIGDTQNPVRVRAGDPLWTVGERGSPGYRAGLIHWEIFSEENLMPTWEQAVDPDDDYNMDCKQILELLDVDKIGCSGILTKEEVENFYASDPDAVRLRRWACQFVIEWGIDLDTALERLKKLQGSLSISHLKDRFTPYLWWDEAVLECVTLPGSKKVWHYNPIALLESWVES